MLFKRKKDNHQIKYGARPAKVPVVMQLEVMECGAACLTMILGYYGKWITLEQAREDCGVSRDGQNALNIVKAARKYGMTAAGSSIGVKGFEEFDEFPCIVYWNRNHFIVLNGIKGNKYYINDPAAGNKVISAEEFRNGYSGIVITMYPNEDFQKGGRPTSVWDYAKKRLVGTGVIFAFVVVTTIITNLTGVITPMFSKVFLDRLLTGHNPTWVTPFLILFAAISLITIVSNWIKTICNLRINGKMSAVGNSAFMWKALHLPMKFYSQRIVGDIQGRQSSAATISSTLINTFAPLVLNSIMMVFYLFVMLKQSVVLSVVGIASSFINYFTSRIVSNRKLNISRKSSRDSSKLYSTTVSGLSMIETIKSTGAETGYFEKWAGYHALVNTGKVKNLKLSQSYGLIPSIVQAITTYLVLILGIMLVIEGKFTEGSVMAFQGLMSSFLSPVGSLIGANQKLLEMRNDMERLDDVLEYPDDEMAIEDNHEGKIITTGKLKGKVEMKNITFGYSPLNKPLLENFNMTLMPGKRIAFVGRSGCGKSTLAKLISGLYQPWSGEILFDGVPIKQIDKDVLRSSVAVVNQEIILFNDSIRDNIRMWDKSIKDFEVILAARDAQIYEDIIKRPGGFDSVLEENGKDLSGGQKQRIEIARTLALDPSIVVMDEATSALDAVTEANVVKSINDRGISCIVVAHRLSTIRDCDEIIVLDQGAVVDRGTHEELMQKCELYKEIVASSQ